VHTPHSFTHRLTANSRQSPRSTHSNTPSSMTRASTKGRNASDGRKAPARSQACQCVLFSPIPQRAYTNTPHQSPASTHSNMPRSTHASAGGGPRQDRLIARNRVGCWGPQSAYCVVHDSTRILHHTTLTANPRQSTKSTHSNTPYGLRSPTQGTKKRIEREQRILVRAAKVEADLAAAALALEKKDDAVRAWGSPAATRGAWAELP
jgi:hypothetical protein